MSSGGWSRCRRAPSSRILDLRLQIADWRFGFSVWVCSIGPMGLTSHNLQSEILNLQSFDPLRIRLHQWSESFPGYCNFNVHVVVGVDLRATNRRTEA